MKWVEHHIEIDPPKRPKKITGTRLASILGLNKWNTPFQTWCEITRTYEKPFEDTIYTIAGKVIEPKQAEYMKTNYGMYGLVTPTDLFGPDYFNKTYGDFFHEEKVFGGMWDYLLKDPDDPTKVDTVFEMKTTKRSEDWEDDIPEYYAMQAALYAYLLKVDNVCMVCSILEDSDYEHPELFQPSIHNTIIRTFQVSTRYPHFEDTLASCLAWWDDCVIGGISPDYDEKLDKEYLTALRNVSVSTVDTALLEEAEQLEAELEAHDAEVADKKKRLTVIKDAIKDQLVNSFVAGAKTATMNGPKTTWTVTRSVSAKVDDKKLKADGIYDKYAVEKETYTLRSAAIKEDK